MQYMDNGGVLALWKIGTNCTQTLSGVNTYSGDTTVSEGTLIFSTASAVSSNSTFRLTTAPGAHAALALNYAGDAPVKGLFIDGVQMPIGTYSASTPPITGTGTISVTGFAPVSLEVSQTGSALTFSWQGVYKLQAKTNNIIGLVRLSRWRHESGERHGGSDQGSVYFRLSTY
jgi:autotransporter-associated beta strand protein